MVKKYIINLNGKYLKTIIGTPTYTQNQEEALMFNLAASAEFLVDKRHELREAYIEEIELYE